jgi:hypothetical protein
MSLAHLPAPDPEAVADDRQAAIDAAVQRALGRFAGRATIDAPELAELMGWGRSTAFDAINAGVVPSLRIGRRVVVPVPGLVAVLLGARTNGNASVRDEGPAPDVPALVMNDRGDHRSRVLPEG